MKFLKKISTHPALYFLALSLVTWIGLEWFWDAICKNAECTYVTRYSIIQPALVYAKTAIILSIIFLVLPRHYGKSWLFFMAPWALPLSIALTIGLEGGSFLSVSYKAASIFAGQVLGAATVIFIIAKALLLKFKVIKL